MVSHSLTSQWLVNWWLIVWLNSCQLDNPCKPLLAFGFQPSANMIHNWIPITHDEPFWAVTTITNHWTIGFRRLLLALLHHQGTALAMPLRTGTTAAPPAVEARTLMNGMSRINAEPQAMRKKNITINHLILTHVSISANIHFHVCTYVSVNECLCNVCTRVLKYTQVNKDW